MRRRAGRARRHHLLAKPARKAHRHHPKHKHVGKLHHHRKILLKPTRPTSGSVVKPHHKKKHRAPTGKPRGRPLLGSTLPHKPKPAKGGKVGRPKTGAAKNPSAGTHTTRRPVQKKK